MSQQTVKLVALKKVTHVGTLNPADKGRQGESHEGSGLSFSKHPEEWERIARLGGQPWWEASLAGFSIVDGHALVRKHAKALGQWGVDQGYLTQGQGWEVSWEDEDMGRVSMMLGSKAEAHEEVEDRDAKVRQVDVHLPTVKLLAAMKHDIKRAGKPAVDIPQDAATVWAKDNELHGIWWSDTLDPGCLSAPRGVLFEDFVEQAKFELVRAVPTGTVKRKGPR
jgi:hypothetical protein